MKINLFVNSIRQALGQAFGMGLDNKREKAWCEYGYKEELSFNDFVKAYRRCGLAFRSVNHINSKTWSDYPILYRGSKAEEDQVQDEYEIKLNKVFNNDVWYEFKEADKRRLIGRWSALILYFDDAEKVSMGDPVYDGSTLVKVKSAWASSLRVSKTDENGNPLLWSYTTISADNEKKSVTIHNDRVFILGDRTQDGMSLLEPGFNYLVDLEKITGGGAESFAKNATWKFVFNFDPDAEIGGVNNDKEETQAVKKGLNKLVTDLNVGKDSAVVTQGVDVTPLSAPVPNPTPNFEVSAQSFAASVGIPYRILVGNQMGERASTEDLKQDNKNIQSRREFDISREILALAYKVIKLIGFEDEEIGVTWEDLTVPSLEEKLEASLKLAQINKEVGFITGELPFTIEETRSAAGYDTTTDNTEI